jgi:hypothetical protein
MTIIITIILCVISLILNIFLITSLNINLKKIEIYESWILNYQKIVKETYLLLKEVDDKEIFEKDDEVGAVFSNIREIIQDLKEKTYEEDFDKKN